MNRERGDRAGTQGQSANAIGGAWPRVKRALLMGNTRKPVSNDYAPLLGEFTWRMRFARGKDRRKRVFETARGLAGQEYGVGCQSEMWGKAGFLCAGKSPLVR